MVSVAIDRKAGLSSAAAWKGPCRVATTANITLSGLQTIDGVVVVTDDRVLVKNQTTATQNGIYIADTGDWQRAKDFSRTDDVLKGTSVVVTDGTVGAGPYQVTSTDPIVFDTSTITIISNSVANAASILAAIKTVDGAGSGLDADLLDGQSGAYYLAASAYTAADVLAKLLTVDGAGSGLDADTLDGLSSASYQLASGYTAADVLAKLLTVDGAGSGVDADLLDGLNGAAYAPLASPTFTGTPAAPTPANTVNTTQLPTMAALQSVLAALIGNVAATLNLGTFTGATIADSSSVKTALQALETSLELKLNSSGYTAADVLAKLLTVDGAGSGIDADLLDGQSSAAFQLASTLLAAIAALGANGLVARTAAGTAAARTITGTAAQITVTNGDGVAGNPTLSLPADVLIPTVLTIPNTGLHILDTNATHDYIIAPNGNATADRNITLDVPNGNATIITIIASGTNANGRYRRWSDGFMECWFTDAGGLSSDTAEGSGYRSPAAATWTYPCDVAYIEDVTHPLVVSGKVNTLARWCTVNAPGLTSCTYRHYSFASSAGTTQTTSLKAEGWFQ